MNRQPELPEFFRDLEIERMLRMDTVELEWKQQEIERDDTNCN